MLSRGERVLPAGEQVATGLLFPSSHFFHLCMSLALRYHDMKVDSGHSGNRKFQLKMGTESQGTYHVMADWNFQSHP